jgi:sugar transferase (PEP-CTERM/EpsH1 system associated)
MSRRPRIVQVIPSLRVGGLENVVLRLTQALAPWAEQVVVTPSESGPLKARFPEGVRVVAMAEEHRPDRWNALRMARLFRSVRPDIVHSRNWTCIDAIVGARLARVPVVIHGEHGREATDPEGRDPRRRRVRRLLAPLVTEFVTVGRALATWLIEEVRVPASRVRTIHNGVDTQVFYAGDRQAVRLGLGLPTEVPIIGTVGRLDPVKDQAGLIRAFALATRGQPALLLIAGEGPSRAELDAVCRNLGLTERVRLLGERDDISRLLRALDVFVLSSIGEGTSNAILEAMATGLPVVATRVGGNGELVRDGVTGRLVEPRRPEELAEALLGYLHEPSLGETHGLAGRARAEQEFSLARMCDGYAELYRAHLPAEALA